MRIVDSFELKALSYIGIGPSVRLTLIEDNDDLAKCDMSSIKILGNCSNILFARDSYESGFGRLDGEFRKMAVVDREKCIVRAGAGMSVNSLILQCAELGMGGMEELYGIPGTIGGMIRCNAGAYGREIKDNLISVSTMDNEIPAEHIEFSYRHCSMRDTMLFAVFRMQHGDKDSIIEKVRAFRKERQQRMPVGRSLGSVFKNPSPKQSAWELIDRCGFRGKCEKDICVSEEHANIIINTGKGSAHDFISLAENIRKTVREQTGTELEYEIEIY